MSRLPFRWKWLFYAAGGFALFFALFLGAAAVLLPKFLPPEKIRSLVIEQISKQLQRKVTVGEVRFHPLEGIRINDLQISNRPGEPWDAGSFLKVRRIGVDYYLFPLLWGQLKIKEILLEEPEILIERLSVEEFNFSDWVKKPQGAVNQEKQPPEGSSFSKTALLLEVGRLRVEKGKLTYRDYSIKPVQDLRLKDLFFEVRGLSLTGGKTELVWDAPLEYAGGLYRWRGKGGFQYFAAKDRLKNIRLAGDLNGVRFEIRGEVEALTQDTAPRLEGFLGADAALMPALLPPTAPKFPPEWKLSGPVSVTFETSGSMQKGVGVKGRLAAEKMEIRLGEYFFKEKDAPLNGDFLMVSGLDFFKLQSFHFMLQDWKLSGNFAVTGLPKHPSLPADPAFVFNVLGKDMPLSGLPKAVPLLTGYTFGGKVDFRLSAAGKIRKPDTWETEGFLELGDIRCTHPKGVKILEEMKGRLTWARGVAKWPDLTFRLMEAPVKFSFSFQGLQPGAMMNLETWKAQATYQLSAGSVDLEKLLPLMPKPDHDKKAAETKKQEPKSVKRKFLNIPPGFSLSGTAECKSFYFRKLALEDVSLKTTVQKQVFEASGTLKAFEGKASGAYSQLFNGKWESPLSFAVTLAGVSAQKAVNDTVDSFVKKNSEQYKDKILGKMNFSFLGSAMQNNNDPRVFRKTLKGEGPFQITGVQIQGLALLGTVFQSLKERSDALKMEQLDGKIALKDEKVFLEAQSTGSTGRMRLKGAVDFDGNYAPSLRLENDIRKEYLDSEKVLSFIPSALRGKIDWSRAADAQGFVPLDFELKGKISDPPGAGALDTRRLMRNVEESYKREIQQKTQEKLEGVKEKLKGLFGK